MIRLKLFFKCVDIRNVLKLLFLSFALVSCDYDLYYDYCIKNESGESIVINFQSQDTNDSTLTIESGEETKLGTFITFGNHIKNYGLNPDVYFEGLEINQGAIEGLNDYLSNDNWEYQEKSKSHAKYILTIDQDDFNGE